MSRRRSQPFKDIDLNEHRQSEAENVISEPDNVARDEQAHDVWEAFREEHHEAIEQLPLSLHRQLTLMRELDEQAREYNDDLLLFLRKYIILRQSACARHWLDLPNTVQSATVAEAYQSTLSPNLTSDAQDGITTPPSGPLTSLLTVQKHVTPMSFQPPDRRKSPETSREMLSHIALLLEEILRASEEKVNLAQASYDSVDRHIRLLDQAIKEQETSIVLGIRSGTHPAPIVLPDIVVPRWARSSRVTLSPVPSHLSSDTPNHPSQETGDGDMAPMIGIVSDGSTGNQLRRKKGGGSRKWQKKDFEKQPTPPDQDEPRYCYCNEVSFGEMIACDGKWCKQEWFHLGCVGLTEAPKNSRKWYCRDCRAGQSGRRN